jgi:hypothetical protein
LSIIYLLAVPQLRQRAERSVEDHAVLVLPVGDGEGAEYYCEEGAGCCWLKNNIIIKLDWKVIYSYIFNKKID